MKYALIGCGKISPNHIQAARTMAWKNRSPLRSGSGSSNPADRRSNWEGVAVYTRPSHHAGTGTSRLVAIATDSGQPTPEIALDCWKAGSHVPLKKPCLSSAGGGSDHRHCPDCGLPGGCPVIKNRFNRIGAVHPQSHGDRPLGKSPMERAIFAGTVRPVL